MFFYEFGRVDVVSGWPARMSSFNLPVPKLWVPRPAACIARRAFWQARFYDFNVWKASKRVVKLRYMHQNPVKRLWWKRPSNGAGAVIVSIFSTRPGR
jgi:hypothetical protein